MNGYAARVFKVINGACLSVQRGHWTETHEFVQDEAPVEVRIFDVDILPEHEADAVRFLVELFDRRGAIVTVYPHEEKDTQGRTVANICQAPEDLGTFLWLMGYARAIGSCAVCSEEERIKC